MPKQSLGAEPWLPRVLHVVAPAVIGGLETVVQSLAVGRHARGGNTAVAALLPSADIPHPFVAPLEDAGVPVLQIALPPRAYRAQQRAIRRCAVETGAEIIHSHGYHPDLLVPGAARAARVATVTTVHGFTGGGWKNRLYERLQRRAFRGYDATVAVSRPLRNRLARIVPPGALHLLPNAWGEQTRTLPRAAARRQLNLDPEHYVIGWVGRLSQEKGPDVLLAALEQVQDLPVHTAFLGSGRLLPRLKEQVAESKLRSRVHWLGNVSQAGALFSAFDLLVLSSRTEGTPMVLFEAMAAAVPIVATSVGGVPDVVGPDEAFPVPPDDPAALARTIRYVYQNRDEAARRAEKAAERLGSVFGLAAWLDGYETIYQGVTTARGK